ncbi:hypothetical protein [Congregibacter sp.]|uniref:hypothetical protein n=1 Tax=Congregibacter sp. TaxID=2744308 RepID=UPI003F6D1943
MMSPERLEGLLDSYGSKEECWPDEQRQQMLACLESFPHLARQLSETRDLDVMLDSYRPDPINLEQRIFAALPVSVSDRIVRWLFPYPPQLWWRPVMAATFPLLLGLAIGMESQSVTSVTDWALQEQNLLLPVTTEEAWYE